MQVVKEVAVEVGVAVEVAVEVGLAVERGEHLRAVDLILARAQHRVDPRPGDGDGEAGGDAGGPGEEGEGGDDGW